MTMAVFLNKISYMNVEIMSDHLILQEFEEKRFKTFKKFYCKSTVVCLL